MSPNKSVISIREIKKFLKNNYNIVGSVKKLNGEIDYNFKIYSSDNKK